MNNKVVVAAAGAGKTTHLVGEALKHKGGRVLITTYTQANEAEIRKKIIQINKCIPENVTVQTWFSFLLQHGVRPYQGCIFEKNIKGLVLVNNQSGVKYYRNGNPVYFKEKDEFEKYYFNNDLKIYSDKLAKFILRCDNVTKGNVIDRLSRIYSYIFIDEVQDLAGYDLELLKLLFKSRIGVLMVGDPRQGTYSTSNSPKNKKFKKSKITRFFGDESLHIETDTESLTVNYRSIPAICEFSNRLFPDLPKTTSGNTQKTDHDGIFMVKNQDVDVYLHKYKPTQLRDNVTRAVNEKFDAMNFGESKGLCFERVLIYPTQPIINWLLDNESELAPTSRSKLYVAITRAKFSVGIVHDDDIEGIDRFTY